MRQNQVKKEWFDDVPRNVRTPNLIGIGLLIFGVFGFFIWASLAPINGAVIIPGNFVASGENKIVQHLEGGVIREILVREGDIVEEGQVLMRLDPTDPKALQARLTLKKYRSIAQRARLNAEIEGTPSVVFPTEFIRASENSDIRDIIDGQLKEFRARQENLQFMIGTIEKGLLSIREGIQGNEAQIIAVKRQLSLIIEEIESKREIYEKGYVRKSEFLALQRAKAGLEGQIAQLSSAISDGRERIAREEQRILQTKADQVRRATEELRIIEADLDDVNERIRVAENATARIEIKAPVRGTVIKMFYNTAGGVIGAGKEVLELLPLDERLVITGRVRPQDIGSIHIGQQALVRLSALNQRVTPMIPGTITYVSADSLPDPRNSRPGILANTYVIKIALDEAEAAKIDNFRSTPGMPAEIFAKTNERTFLGYLLKPVADSFSRSFRER